MKKILVFIAIFLCTTSKINAEDIKRIIVGNVDAKITIVAFESLTCSHCANFHKDVYPQLKKEYLDTGLAKIEFRHFPLDIAAFNASKVSQCKNDGDSSMLNSLFANQQKWVKGNSAAEANKNLQKFFIYKNPSTNENEIGAKTKNGNIYEFQIKGLMMSNEFQELKQYVLNDL